MPSPCTIALSRTLSRGLGAALVVTTLATAVTTPAVADVLTATDTRWRITATAPAGAGWHSNASFDDSAWAAATELYNVSA